MSWEGRLQRVYEIKLGLAGGYVRKVNRNKPSSLLNSEYVKQNGSGSYVVARSGRMLLRPEIDAPKYRNYYGNEKSANQLYQKKIKKEYAKLKRKLRGR